VLEAVGPYGANRGDIGYGARDLFGGGKQIVFIDG